MILNQFDDITDFDLDFNGSIQHLLSARSLRKEHA